MVSEEESVRKKHVGEKAAGSKAMVMTLNFIPGEKRKL